jgi:thiamine biosynthesis lipoprotein
MGTRFELAGHGMPEPGLRAAAEEAFEEVRRLEDLLSLYRSRSDIGRINAAAGNGKWIPVSPVTYQLLEFALRVGRDTDGGFDPTVGPVVRAWGFHGGDGSRPDPKALADALAACGPAQLEFAAESGAIRLRAAGAQLDLGAVGKGFALDRAAGILEEAGLGHFLLHGGTSSIVARGSAPDGGPWLVGLGSIGIPGGPTPAPAALADTSLSVSAVWGRGFLEKGRHLGHVIDPRNGEPVGHSVSAAVRGPSAALTDALSTALLVLGARFAEELPRRFPGYEALHLGTATGGDGIQAIR